MIFEDKPVEFLLFQLQICHGNQLIQFKLGLNDLSLPGRISPALLLALVDPDVQKQDKTRGHDQIKTEWMKNKVQQVNIMWKMTSVHQWGISGSYLTDPQMMMMRSTAKKKERSTPRIICSSLVNTPSTLQTGRRQKVRVTETAKVTCGRAPCRIPAVLMCSEKSESVYWPLMFVALNLKLLNTEQQSRFTFPEHSNAGAAGRERAGALTRRQCLASVGHCTKRPCCSPCSHRAAQSRTRQPSDWASRGQTHCDLLSHDCPLNMAGWGSPSQSGRGQDDWKMHSSRWSGSPCPSLWHDGSQGEKGRSGHSVRFLLTFHPAGAWTYIV